jgi:heavy metal sensor kinase
MRSIRLSLVVYFLGLLLVALGVASVLVYRTVQRTLQDKEQTSRTLIQARYEDRCREERQRLDEKLRTRAQTLARMVQIKIHWGRMSARYLPMLGVLTGRVGPNAHLQVPLWLAQGPWWGRNPFHPPNSFETWRKIVADVNLTDSDVLLPLEEHPGEYFQIDTNSWAPPKRSKSAIDRGLYFPDPEGFGEGEALYWAFDDLELAPGLLVRRVRLKAAGAKRINVRPPRLGPPRSAIPPPGFPEAGRQWPRPEPPPLFIVIQVGIDRSRLDATLGQLRAGRDADLAALEGQTSAALGRQRDRLLGISSVTFAATVLGAFGLVWLGLLPLRRLSDAVSQVSPRDFRLPLGPGSLPAELQPIARRLETTLDALKRAFAREKQATADLSHELRTPLAALLTTTELALRKPRSGEDYRELLRDCRLSAQQMNQIVERLLTLARLDAGVDVLRPQPVDVAAVAEQCAAVVRPLAEAQGLRLEVHNECGEAGAGASSSRMATDPDKLREVLTNLLHNAVQYNRPNGEIDLRVARDNGHLQVEVRDTGIGIAPEARDCVFERFYRADPSRNSDGLHAGLGLAIVKEYVDLMGGTIAVDSAEGQGSTFRVRLPVR